MAASGLVLQWQGDLGFTVQLGMGQVIQVAGDLRTTHYRLHQYICRVFGLEPGMLTMPLIPDNIYLPGEWTGTQVGDYKRMLECASKAPHDAWTDPAPWLEVTQEEWCRFGEHPCWVSDPERQIYPVCDEVRVGSRVFRSTVAHDEITGRMLTPELYFTPAGRALGRINWVLPKHFRKNPVRACDDAEATVQEAVREVEVPNAAPVQLAATASPLAAVVASILAPAAVPVADAVCDLDTGFEKRFGPEGGPYEKGYYIAQNRYNADIRKFMRIPMTMAEWKSGVWSKTGSMERGSRTADRDVVAQKVQDMRKFGKDRRPRALAQLLMKIDLIADGTVSTACALFKELRDPQWEIDLEANTVVNRF